MLFSGTSRRKFPPVAATFRSGHLLRVPLLSSELYSPIPLQWCGAFIVKLTYL